MFRRRNNLGEVVSLVQNAAQPPWRYIGDEPYWVHAARETPTGVQPVAFTRFPFLQDAMANFARFHCPPVARRTAVVVDKNKQFIVGYTAIDNHKVDWFGTDHGFWVLEKFFDPASVAVWRTTAMEDHPPITEEDRDRSHDSR